jgi:hypothetical protein
LLSGCLRCLDRGCCKDLKKKPDEKNDDEVNTKKTSLTDLEILYTGP